MLNYKLIPHDSFKAVIFKDPKKKMFKFSPGSAPDQQVWLRGLKSAPSSSSPQLPWDVAVQI